MTVPSRTAAGALDILHTALAGRTIIGVPTTRQLDVVEMLLAATGCTTGLQGGRAAAMMAGRPLVRPDATSDQLAAQHMDEWLRKEGDAPSHPPLSLPMGLPDMMRAMGIGVARVSALLEVLHAVHVTSGDATIRLYRSGRLCRGTYRRGRLSWTDGIVTVPGGLLPRSVRSALVGEPLGRLVDDPILADQRIRLVCATSPRDGLQRIVTMDEGRRIVL